MKLLSLFSGIGAFERALENLDMNYELVNYCEIDKYASKAYALLHCNGDESKNLWDINKVTGEGIEADIITYGYPCTDLSTAGKQKGFFDENGNKTRSGLVWDAMRVIGNVRPKIALCENVKALTSKKFEEGFHAILKTLEEMGYSNYYQILNAKDYGVPQNRERIFIVSIRNDNKYNFPQPQELQTHLDDLLEYTDHPIQTDRLDLTECKEGAYNPMPDGTCRTIKATYGQSSQACLLRTGNQGATGVAYKFPKEQPLETNLFDLLEDVDEEKYFVKPETAEKIKNSDFVQRARLIQEKDYCDTLMARDYKEPKMVYVFPKKQKLDKCLKDVLETEVDNKYYLSDKLMQKAKETGLLKKCYLQWDSSGKHYNSQNDRAYYENGVAPTLSHSNSNGNKAQVLLNIYPSGGQAGNVYNAEGIAPTMVCNGAGGGGKEIKIVVGAAMRGRKENGEWEQQIEISNREMSNALTSVQKDSLVCEKTNKTVRIGNVYNDEKFTGGSFGGNLWSTDGIAPACKCTAAASQQYIPIHIGNVFGENCGTGYTGNVWDSNGISPTLTTMQGGGRQPSIPDKTGEEIRIRRLTPAECFKLMGFEYQDAYMLSENKISNSQLYKMAGNSIVVDVLMAIFNEMRKQGII